MQEVVENSELLTVLNWGWRTIRSCLESRVFFRKMVRCQCHCEWKSGWRWWFGFPKSLRDWSCLSSEISIKAPQSPFLYHQVTSCLIKAASSWDLPLVDRIGKKHPDRLPYGKASLHPPTCFRSPLRNQSVASTAWDILLLQLGSCQDNRPCTTCLLAASGRKRK